MNGTLHIFPDIAISFFYIYGRYVGIGTAEFLKEGCNIRRETVSKVFIYISSLIIPVNSILFLLFKFLLIFSKIFEEIKLYVGNVY